MSKRTRVETLQKLVELAESEEGLLPGAPKRVNACLLKRAKARLDRAVEEVQSVG